jgi:aspartate carbamoyltransferase catalytic subunit
MNNLLSLTDLNNNEINNLLFLAQQICDKKINKIDNFLDGKIIANLFFEPSTRTQYSFIVAETKLGAKSINFNVTNSSLSKAETLYDTIKTFDSFHIDALVIRDSNDQ